MKYLSIPILMILLFNACAQGENTMTNNVNLQTKLVITQKMLKSEYLISEAGTLVAELYDIRTSAESAAVLRSLPIQWGTVEALMVYISEVTNGGHHQYFWNSQGFFVDLVESGLEYYGATQHLEIFRNALRRYNPQQYQVEYQESDWHKAFTRGYKEERYEDLDSRYYDIEPKLEDIVEKYIRKNLSEFQ